jgi:arylsulfatase A-like enzyme/tetratricopeptide (TPR) repeat protein
LKKARKILALIVALAGLVGLLFSVMVLTRAQRAPNLVLIVIDTMRADHLSCYGYEWIRTPNIDNLARNGVLFKNAVSHIPLTLPSLSSIMTSTLPPTNGVHYNEGFYLDESAQTLAEILEEEGYWTGAVLGAVVLDSINGISQGFSRYNDDFGKFSGNLPHIKLLEKQLNYTQRRASEVTDLSLNLSDSLVDDRPFFLFIHYFDPHSPYDPPPPYSLIDPTLEKGSDEVRTQFYDGEIAYTDEHIGRLLKGLEERGLLENTLVVLTTDHGEALGEHGEKSHGYYNYEGTLHIPLVFSWPKEFPQGVIYDNLARHIDLAPTILDILGIEGKDGGSFQGESLYPFGQGKSPDFSYLESAMTYIIFGWGGSRGVRSTEWKYIASPQEELYDLREDPGEEDNLIDRMPQVADSLREVMEEIVTGIDIFQGEETGQEMSSGKGGRPGSPEIEEKLRALGYIGAPDMVISGYEEMFDRSLPDPKEKIGDFDLVLTSNLHLRIGMAYMEMDSLEKAISHLDDAIQSYPDNEEAYFYLGLAYGELGEYEKAEESFGMTLDLNPSHLNARLAAVDNHLAQGDSVNAQVELEGVFSLGIDKSEELVLGGWLWDRLGRKDQAVKAMKKVLELDRDHLVARLYLGEHYLLQNQYEEAFSFLEPTIVNLSDKDTLATRVYYGLGRCYANRGNLEEAERLFQRVISLDSTAAGGYNQLGLIHVEVHSNLGVANYNLGRYSESRREFEAYLPHAENEEEASRLRLFIEHIKELE